MKKADRVERAKLYAAKYADALEKEAQDDEHGLVLLFDAWERMAALHGTQETLVQLAGRLAWHAAKYDGLLNTIKDQGNER